MTDYIKQNKNWNRPYILGVAGGSGSGKTYFAKELLSKLGPEICSLIYQDNFYFDQSQKFDFDGGSVNFDHPDSIDFLLLAQHLNCLRSNRSTSIPIYDFSTHSRIRETLEIHPTKIIIVDGILIFHSPEVRALLDDFVFFDTPEEIRYQRRLERDVHERGREAEGVRNQFIKQVRPMHDLFVAPSKIYANTKVNELTDYPIVLDTYLKKIQVIINS